MGNLSLIIARREVKPAVVMKTLSGRFWFVIFGVIVIVAVGSCCCLKSIPGIAYSVEIGNMQRDQYVKWKNEGDFDNALAQLCKQGTYCIYTNTDRNHPYRASNAPCINCDRRNIKTAKVTKSKVADNTAAGQSAANDPNVMHRVQSPDPGDIKKVLDALEQ